MCRLVSINFYNFRKSMMRWAKSIDKFNFLLVVCCYGFDVPVSGGLKVGDRVVIFPWIGCRTCSYCEDQRNDLCSQGFHSFGVVTPGG